MRINPRSGTSLTIIGTVLLAVIVATSLYVQNHDASSIDPQPAGKLAPAVIQKEKAVAAVLAPERGDAREPVPQRQGLDASNLYKDAFVLWDRLTDEERQILSQPRDAVNQQVADELFEKIQPIMALLHEASKADYCDWSLGELTADTKLPHLSRAQNLAKLALWNAAHRMPTDPDGAVQDLVARAQLGHDLSESLIGYLVEISFEPGAANLLRQHGATLTPTAAELAQELFSTPALEPDIRRAVQAEAAAAAAFVNLSPEARLEMLAHSTPGVETKDAQALARRRQLEEFLQDPSRVAAEAEYIRQLYDRLGEAMLWPRAQYDAWWKGIDAELSTHPLAQLFVPFVGGMRNAVDRSRVQRSMMVAGLAILQEGPAQLAQYRDPYTSGAFSYVPNATGFELRSTYQHKGKPLRMDFATPPE